MASGHGLLAHLMLLLDDSSPEAIAVDPMRPASAVRIEAALIATWPRLQGRVHRIDARIADVPLEASDLVVSVHACGALTDEVLRHAMNAKANVAVLPCCHELLTCDTGGLEGWMDGSLAIDATRAARLRHANYKVHAQTIPANITPKNRLLLGLRPALNEAIVR